MQSYNLALPGSLNLLLTLPRPVFDDEHARLLLGAYVPGAVFVDAPPAVPSISLNFRESATTRLVHGRWEVTLWAEWHDSSLLDFIHLVYAVCRENWLRNDLYCVHSACVDGILIAGHSGSGKTSTALRLVSKGARLFASNKTLVAVAVDGLRAVAGTRTITTKAEDAERHLSGDARKIDYVGRKAFLLDAAMYEPADSVAIRKIAISRLNDGADDCARLSSVSAMHRLYSFFMDSVNADAILCDGAAVFSASLVPGTEQRLASRLASALANVPTLAVTGSMPFIIKALEEPHAA